ncbi:hypothetical protein BD626DRAFT_154470 [Schizophyllum amplum]|uniref:Uncharacterized protein n=1 Tax=Schizophyllum amplum TaxID=97359 RepID=A0A550C3Q2_9AGAR|nr:hypothetical protein BD626DRAFT_154470 [Auriculariopsis ampla]
MATRTRASPFLLLLACSARAAPLQLLDRRDNSNSTLASRQIWGIAVGVVCAFVLSMGLLFYYRRFRARRRSSTRPANTSTWSLSALLSPSPRPPSSTNPSGNIRELTAEQLIGTQATRTGTAAANNAPHHRCEQEEPQATSYTVPDVDDLPSCV